MSFTRGNSDCTISAEPSREPLSTTITSCVSSKHARQRRSFSFVLKLTTTTLTGLGAGMAPCYNIGPMAHEFMLSREGFARLKEELVDLKGPVRTRIAEAIR